MGASPYTAGGFRDEAPAVIPALPDWSPVAKFGGYALPPTAMVGGHACCNGAAHDHGHNHGVVPASQSDLRKLTAGAWRNMGLWGSGCDCFAF